MAKKRKLKGTTKPKIKKSLQRKSGSRPFPKRVGWSFDTINYIAFGIGILVMIGGYISLATGSETLAPILLVLSYCVIIPIAIILKPTKQKINKSSIGNTGD